MIGEDGQLFWYGDGEQVECCEEFEIEECFFDVEELLKCNLIDVECVLYMYQRFGGF